MKERLLCHAIIGRTGGKELVKRVKVVCDFINPLLQFSNQSVCFTVCTVKTSTFLSDHELELNLSENSLCSVVNKRFQK